MTTSRTRKSWKKKLLLVIFGLSFGLLMSEVLLRVIGYSYPLFYRTDYYRGFALLPGAEGRYQREGGSYVRINSDGLRDREHARAKPANTVRIAVLGDSFTEAMHLPMEQTFWYLLQQKLQDCNAFPGRQVEVINFGVSGYGTAQELMTLRQEVWNYLPDIVLLAFTTLNDVYDNSRALSKTEDVPYFIYRDGLLAYDASFRDSKTYRQRYSRVNQVGRWIHNHLRVIQLIHHVQFVAKLRLTDWRNRRKLARTQSRSSAESMLTIPKAEEIGIENMIYFEPRDEDWKEAWHVTEGLVEEIRNDVNQKGAKFLLVTLSNAIQVYPDPVVRQRFLQQISGDTIFYPNLRLRALADREQIDFLDLAQPMQAYADQNRVFLHGFGSDLGNGHWNADGHRLAAELIAQKLCSDGAVARP
ncbi:MAG: G-D-S-L family lipolytic protein [Acidobacteria bacterium]|nr:MAG: G-D-S-L family lipolytic protein [Acidobacteriota bacterium]